MNEAFWSWWAAHRDEIAEAIDSGRGVSDDQVDDLRRHVAAIDERLDWELAPGARARHALVVTPAGDPDVRAVAERWRRSAPPPDETWEYHATRQPSIDDLSSRLSLDGHEVDLTRLEAATATDEERAEVDVTVHHPRFAEMGESTRGRVALLCLDWLLGEEGVERWIGAIDAAVERPPGAGPFRAIVDAVHELETAHPAGQWTLLEATDDEGLPVVAGIVRPFKPVDHPLLDTHVALTRTYAARDDGLPDRPELADLHALEDDLGTVLGEDAFLAAYVTHAGERTFHVYVDGESAAPDRLRGWARRRGLHAEVEADPAWDAIAPFR